MIKILNLTDFIVVKLQLNELMASLNSFNLLDQILSEAKFLNNANINYCLIFIKIKKSTIYNQNLIYTVSLNIN